MSTLPSSSTGHPRTYEEIEPLRPRRPVTGRNVSFNTAPVNGASPTPESPSRKKEDNWQRVNRLAQNVDPNIVPAPPSTARPCVTPFVAYDDSFAALLGESPSIKLIISDPRAPFFYSGGAWIPRSSTLFLTSGLLQDPDPSAVSSARKRTEISKIEFYAPHDFSRDKVRSQDRNYMAAGCARYPLADSTGIVLCAQGTLSEPAGLVYVDTKRPHKSHMLLNNFQGRPFNSPCDIAANSIDNCLYFTDPAYGFERCYRPRPQLPTGHIYRFDPLSGDCRVVANGLARPGGIAFSPDYTVLYVSDLEDKHGGTTLYAFDMIYTACPPRRPRPLAPSISSISNGRSGTPNSHQKKTSLSSTESSSDSSQHYYRASPTASAQALAVAARYVPPSSTSSTANGQQAPNLSRSNSSTSRPLRFMSSLNLKNSFNTTPSLAQPPHQHQAVRQPRPLSPPLTASSSGHSGSAAVTDGAGNCGAFVASKRLFAYSPSVAPSGGIATDPLQGNVWLGTEEGVEVFSGCAGSLVGKVLVPEDEFVSPVDKSRERKKMTGVSRVAFGNEGEAWLLGGESLWRIGFGGTTGAGD